VVGQALRYVAEYEGQWLALLVFSSGPTARAAGRT
jgi:hypothetical protein